MHAITTDLDYFIDILGLADSAELHGLACGLLCLNDHLSHQQWLDYVSQTATGVLTESEDLLLSLFSTTRAQFADDDFNFTLLLPDDDEYELIPRASALASWCQGFIAAIAFSETNKNMQLSEEVEEFIKDVEQIANLELSATNNSEADEVAYTEIVEYLRVGVMLIKQTGLGSPKDKNPVLH